MTHWSLARIVPAPTVGNVVNPVPILQDKLVPLAGEVVKSGRPPRLPTVQSTNYPPFTLYLHQLKQDTPHNLIIIYIIQYYLSHVCEIFDSICIVSETDTIRRGYGQAAMLTHTLQQLTILAAVVAVGQLAEQIAALHVCLLGALCVA
jgi:hypothetical protein